MRIWGTQPESIDRAEDRDQWFDLLTELKIDQPPGDMVTSEEQALVAAEKLGYPVMVRPSFVLGGRAMEVVYRWVTSPHPSLPPGPGYKCNCDAAGEAGAFSFRLTSTQRALGSPCASHPGPTVQTPACWASSGCTLATMHGCVAVQCSAPCPMEYFFGTF